MKSSEIRKRFLKFFESRGYAVVKSSSLLPDDPSVLLTTAGMQQFKPYYVGKADPMRDFGSRNTTSIQKSFRTSDIEEVGDNTHLTFFEMLGNFSFPSPSAKGDNFSAGDGSLPAGRQAPGGKKETIHFAYEFLVNELGIDRERMYITIFGGDDSHSIGSGQAIPEDKESFRIWHEEIGMPKEKIKKHGRADNFWGPTGTEGPCGPTTEIYVDGVEIWNLVFNEYYSKPKGDGQKGSELVKLENPGVDTGMGFERFAAVLQGVSNVFETDLIKPLVDMVNETQPALEERVVRVLADHLRASVFLIADGVRPSNKEAGYILRRLLRRIMVYGIKYDIHADLFVLAVDVVKNIFSEVYPEVSRTKEITDVWMDEKTKFEKAIALGVKEVEKYEAITAKDAFMIYETFGLPFELLQELVPAKISFGEGSASGGKDLKEAFDAEMKKHQEISRAGQEKKFGGHGLILNTGELKAANQEELEKVTRLHTSTHLVQAALRKVLGDEVHQMGSDITVERARFDFTFPRKLTEEEVKKVEDLVNDAVNRDLPVSYEELPIEEAKKTGALYFFKEKYPETVKVYSMGDFSKEFCGGPHVTNTLKVGKFKIAKQEAVGAGVRRIRLSVE